MRKDASSQYLTPAEISKLFLRLYPNARGFAKFVLRWRPRITPIEEVFRRVPPADRVVEMGCGRGMLSVLLSVSGRVKNILGIDVSESAISVAKDAARTLNTGIDFCHVSSFADWPQDTFDVVLCIDTLHHIPPEEQREFMRRLGGLCAHGGTLILEDIPPFPWWRRCINTLHDLVISKQLVHYRHPKEIAEWFQSEGFAISEEILFARLWYGYYLFVARKE
ncbi:MAG: hypothetical protein UX74_C0015G0010 [Parcubacteria group bacterium GW2011_GWA2_47_10b]|uniref:Methyltransferase domain-containing protein n=1 Tax=Candidatus Ryanbacteria bacterium RIFCSPLOWO2_02_FULL_47_14 TaxID=1802129 RepID=A0A1G2GZG5_9BACT|nr:MAG: hypothetical protein UX74_C0015G0010 [Parcubacteria group bacterium GW2011_GWA2_47_10b]KKU86366.1 MAG: hypothetical protein UY14_C0002G0008 [Parcubacteria group bacterium GW2011_GWA1_47_9]OGZ55616.1 MAG: hypothetical protein A3J04_00645 [Candidatus Ryanbacteria bacterium RIFCSPLOWO2_02_FULL_47_14]